MGPRPTLIGFILPYRSNRGVTARAGIGPEMYEASKKPRRGEMTRRAEPRRLREAELGIDTRTGLYSNQLAIPNVLLSNSVP